MQLKRVISGGQSGVDQAGLYAAKSIGLKTGGWAPKNWKTSEGPKPILLKAFGLQEHSGGYQDRTWANVKDSDATLRLAINFNSIGEICTLNAIRRYSKPYFDIILPDPDLYQMNDAIEWLHSVPGTILNIAGNRQYRDIDTFTMASRFLECLFRSILNSTGGNYE